MITSKEYENLISKLKIQRTKDRRKLNIKQRLAIDLYFGNLYKGISPIGAIINYYLYSGGDTNYKKQYPDYTTVPNNINFLEVVNNIDYCITNSNIYYNKDLFRGVSNGNSIEFSAFLSTSFLPFQSLTYLEGQENEEPACCMLILKNYNGKVIYNPIEDEILLPRKTNWKLTKINIKKLHKNYSGFKHPKYGDYSEHLGTGKKVKFLTFEYLDFSLISQ